MAHSISARKRARQNIRRRARNRRRKAKVKDTIRAFDEAILAGDKKKADEQLKLCYKRLDQIASKGTMHKNTAARKKSRLTMRLAKAFA